VCFRTLAHPNIVAFYGITTLDIGIGLVIELCDMDLLAYSKKLTVRLHQMCSQQCILG